MDGRRVQELAENGIPYDGRDTMDYFEEGKTGFAPLGLHPSLCPNSLAKDSMRRLYTVAGYLQLLRWTVDFQSCLTKFLVSQHDKLVAVRKSRSSDSIEKLVSVERSAEKTQISLDVTLSYSLATISRRS